MLPATKTLNERLEELIKRDRIMLFMKGNPDEPKCGFSSKIVNILRSAGSTFGSFDILSDEEVTILLFSCKAAVPFLC